MPRLHRLCLASSLALLLLLLASVTLAQGPAPDRPPLGDRPTAPAATLARPLPVEPDLLKAALANPDASQDFIVYLKEKADLTSAAAQPSKAERGKAVVASLKATADRSQAALGSDLLKAQAEGKASRVQPFWVTNAIAVVGQGRLLLDLAARPDVDIIRANREWSLPLKPQVAPNAAAAVEWNIHTLRADSVWSLMGIDGRGVVVASMDTGVDWQHPDLAAAYRGTTGGLPDHRGSWYCATDEGYLYPGDGVGHGTHTTGLMVGARGIGVAPGAKWIAVKVFDDRARTTDTWVHDAFQWLLAPGGDPTRAPDIVNGSWSSAARDSLMYRDDVRALRAAGIIPVFSAGNDGPFSESINIPGGYAEVLTVGATDNENRIASFSSRGPTGFAPYKPDVVAPGVNIRSTWHGGGYMVLDGTSMAAPQVSGLAALLRQANPRLTVQQVIDLVRGTARPIGDAPTPNNTVGAGLADAYAAVSLALKAGELGGRVTRAGDGGPVSGATVAASAAESGATLRVQTDATGAYTMPLKAGVYNVTVTAFGYDDFEQRNVYVEEERRTTLNPTLSLLPVGAVLGRVVGTTGAPLAARVIVEGTPVSATAQANTGAYSLALPPGTYRLRVEQRGHRVGRGTVTIAAAGQVVSQDFRLPSAPTILLVDGGAWYYADTLRYYTTALDHRDYLYDIHAVRSQYDDAPTLEQLRRYDVVIWSSAKDSPRYVGADETLADYLRQGGRLLISGQDIAYWDGGGLGNFVAEYFRGFLNARFIADQARTQTVAGEGAYAGATWTLNGPESAANQTLPDVVGYVKPEMSQTVAQYTPDRLAGLLVNRCAPHRSLYLSFGVEGVSGLDARADLLDKGIGLLTEPAPAAALTVHLGRPLQVGPAGAVVTHTLTLRNEGTGAARYRLSVDGAAWPTRVVDPASGASVDSLDVPSCGTRDVLVGVTIPAGSGWNASDAPTVRFTTGDGPTVAVSTAVTVETRTPAPVLLVDDGQWVDVQRYYTQALKTAGIPFDVWKVGQASANGWGPPSAERLALYPVVVWFTGYDFLDNLSLTEEATLTRYLNGGGRLLLSAQDYLFTAGLTRFGSDYLGVQGYTEDQITDSLSGVPGDSVSDGLGPYPLDFVGVFGSARYNHSDALVPTSAASQTFLGSHGRPVGLRVDGGRFRTVFVAAPLETLPADALPTVLWRTIGWLQPLGGSSISSESDIVASGGVLTYTVRLVNRGPLPRTAVSYRGGPPAHSQLLTDTLEGAAVEDGRLVWRGGLPASGIHVIRYAVRVDEGLAAGAALHSEGQIRDETGLTTRVEHTARANVPDLSPTFIAADRQSVQAGDRVTFFASPRNRGAVDAAATLTVTLPAGLSLDPGSALASSGEVAVVGDEVHWRGTAPRSGVPPMLTFQATVTPEYQGGPLTTRLRIDDGFGVALERTAVVGRDWRLFLPLVTKRGRP